MSSVLYQRELKLGKKEVQALKGTGEDPYIPALELLLPDLDGMNAEPLGETTVAMEQIVGTKTASRRDAFSRSFYPLMPEGSEFAEKWSSLAEYHLSEGISDPVIAVEYLNRYYIVEGHKRISVLRHFSAPTVQAIVTRLLPAKSDAPEIIVYYEYLEFYKKTHVSFIILNEQGDYQRLLDLLNEDSERKWNKEERRELFAEYTLFSKTLKSLSAISSYSPANAFLRYLDIFGYAHLKEASPAELKAELSAITFEVKSEAGDTAPELQLEPSENAPKRGLTRLLQSEPAKLKIAFLHDKNAVNSFWTYSHEEGRRQLQEKLAGRVDTVSIFDVLQKDAPAEIGRLADNGYSVIFTTSPRLLDLTLKAAAKYPNVRFLNCSLNVNHPLLRTYYGRMYEAKFLTGVIAGAVSENGRIGYISNYPIYGMPASINAFALGAQMANPDAKVYLEWSTIPNDDIWGKFRWNQVTVISGQDMFMPNSADQDFGVFLLHPNGDRNLALSLWRWDRFYEKIIQSILDGTFSGLQRAEQEGSAINYWWGMNTGVIDVTYTYGLPPQTKRLVELLKRSIMSGDFLPFEGPVYDQSGRLRIREGQLLSPEEIIKMDWLTNNVIGAIPPAECLTDEARALVRIQGVLQNGGDKR